MKHSHHPTILVTGFAPFGGQSINPSWQAVSLLPDRIQDAIIVKRELSVVYFHALEELDQICRDIVPDALLHVGQAGGIDCIRIERVALNLCESSLPDNAGIQLEDTPIIQDGPDAYFTTYPHRKILESIQGIGLPARYSFSAGTYLCNHVLYGSLHAGAGTNRPIGFLHVPYLPEQVKDSDTVAWPCEQISRALLCALEVIACEIADT